MFYTYTEIAMIFSYIFKSLIISCKAFWVFLRFIYLLHIQCSARKYLCKPEENVRSHYRWLWVNLWLLWIEFRTSGGKVNVFTSEPSFQIFFKYFEHIYIQIFTNPLSLFLSSSISNYEFYSLFSLSKSSFCCKTEVETCL